MRRLEKITFGIIVGISLIIIGVYIAVLIGSPYHIGQPLDNEITGQVGDFIGGVIGTIFSAAAFWLLYITLRDQRRESKRQKTESHIFHLLKAYENSVQLMSFDARRLLIDKGSFYIPPKEYKGAEVFQLFYYQFVTCRNELLHLFHRKHFSDIYNSEYLSKIKNNPIYKSRKINITEMAKIDISYSIVYYGLNTEGLMILRSLLKKKYKHQLVDEILNYISLKPARDKEKYNKWKIVSKTSNRQQLIDQVKDIYQWRRLHTKKGYKCKYPEISIDYNGDYERYYTGFQHIMSQHFRQMYQMVRYINTLTDGFTFQDKSNYVKLLRNQMSNYEQTVFFLNSISTFGRAWELEHKVDKDLIDKHKFSDDDFNLITKYEMIKNIPAPEIFGIDYKTYYPSINYEFSPSNLIPPTYH